MATAPAVASALDLFLAQRNSEYTRDMGFAATVLQARAAMQTEDRLRAAQNAQTQVAQSAEQRAIDNQSMTNFRNKLIAPRLGFQANRAAFIETTQPATDALAIRKRLIDSKLGVFTAELNSAITRLDAPRIQQLTGFQVELKANKLVMRSPNSGEPFRDLRTNELVTAFQAREALDARSNNANMTSIDRFIAGPPAAPLIAPAGIDTNPRLRAPATNMTPMKPMPSRETAGLVSSADGLGVDTNVAVANPPADTSALQAQLDMAMMQQPVDYALVQSLQNQIASA